MRQSSTDLYAVLNVASDAGPETIKRAYRKLARGLHHDVAGNTNGAEQFKAVAEAYEILSDPVKRAEYDRARAMMGHTPPPTPAQSNTSTRSTDVVHPQWDEDWVQRMLDEYSFSPFNLSERIIATYLKSEWLYGIALLPMVYLFFTGKLSAETIYGFMLSKASAPGVGSVAPFAGLLIGAVTGWAVALLAALHVIQRHRYSPRYNPGFRRELWQQAGNLFMTLNLVGGIVGLMVGHYLV